MRKIVTNRIVAAFLVIVLSVSAVCVPASASGLADMDSVGQWDSRFDNACSRASALIMAPCCISLGIPVSTAPKTVMWRLFDTAVDNSGTGEVSLDRLNDICAVYNGYFNRPVRQSLFGLKDISNNIATTVFCVCMGFDGSFNFVVEAKPGSGLYRIREKSTGLWVVNSSGLYPYCEGGSMAPTSGGNQWIGERTCSTAAVNMKNYDALNMICSRIKESGTPAQIKPLSTNYKAIWYNRQYYCDPEGRPFVCYANEGQAAINQDRPDTSVTDEDGEPATDETGTVINNPDNSTNIDLSGMTITLPDGTVQVADAVIYDESTKTYYIDSHDTTNNNYTYNYSWTYNINYTSITYIGQTEQYDKYYKVYYELPDGRDSADLTAEDLEQLNFDIDVVNYGRYSDNTSIRYLYHFDGDTNDSSYWNYKTSFTWNTGASLTYMDAGTFNGALYLDETTHDFTVSAPTALGSSEFWLSFRYYQSATAAPVRDSYLTIGGVTALFFDGKYLYSSTGQQLAQISVGSWSEISVVRKANLMFYYLNGLYLGCVPITSVLSSDVQFHFGNQQQTYKYFDELRLLNVASFYGQTNYSCATVPYDTNLVLVLPDSRVTPVADEYYTWTDHGVTVPFDTQTSSFFDHYSSYGWSSPATDVGSSAVASTAGIVFQTRSRLVFKPSACGFAGAAYYICLWLDDGTHYFVYFRSTETGKVVECYAVNIVNGETVSSSSLPFYAFYAETLNSQTEAIISFTQPAIVTRLELLTSMDRCSTYDKHTSVTGVGGALNSLKVPTLAVKSDIDVTDQQIGGARPSVPTKGLVWAMVEDGVISSIQIYDGTAWVACDGRIFTGTRWVPYGSYNIVTLKDFYDVADASGSDFSYIYTETSFWNWWQKSWNAFTNKLFAALSSAGMDTSGGTSSDGTSKSLWQRIKDAFNDTLGALIEALFDLIKEVLKTLISSATDMLKFFFSFLTDAVMTAVKAFFGAFSDSSLFDFFKQPPVVGADGTETDGGYGLPSEVGTAFTFISSVVMVLPPDIRSILFFGIAAMVLFAVFKMVKA